ncbi:MAG: ABC transporter ATP-binding protein [Eubacteriales bacterium]|nr:ABC transporter ATP-binding protein [Eubacteriales bacterium]
MVINFKHINKSYDRAFAIRDLDLFIEDKTFTTLLGPSGCGKTTLLRMAAGLETPDGGEIYLDDRCVFSSEKGINVPPEKRGLGFVFQDFALWPHMTVFENVAFGLRAQKKMAGLEERVKEALHAVQLDEYAQRYPHQLSGGQQQRVAFARAIVIEPSCILFDEPLSALDAILREEMRHELKRLVSGLGITAVFVTHDQTEAMSMSDRIAVLRKGVIEQYDTPENIYNHPATEFVARFVGKSNWMGKTELFRPEAMTLEKKEGFLSYDLPVSSVQYLGDAYEVMVSFQNVTWMFHTGRKIGTGEKQTVYIDPKQIISI